MEVATGNLLWTLSRPTPRPTAGGPKKCWNIAPVWCSVTQDRIRLPEERFNRFSHDLLSEMCEDCVMPTKCSYSGHVGSIGCSADSLGVLSDQYAWMVSRGIGDTPVLSAAFCLHSNQWQWNFGTCLCVVFFRWLEVYHVYLSVLQ